MQHAAQMVDILDASGKVVGQKARHDLNKLTDIHHTVFVQCITPKGGLVLSRIPARQDLPNVYANTLGITAATVRRHNETALLAAIRGVSRELGIENADMHYAGEGLLQLPDNRIYHTTYYVVSEPPPHFSRADIDALITLTPSELRDMLQNHPNQLAPTFITLWEKYLHAIPI